MINYYKILDVNNDSTTVEIKKAYRRLALKWHPDINKSSNAQEKFIEINEAYELLVSDSKRKLYDSILKQNSNKATDSEVNFSKYKEWTEEARETANSRSKMSYSEFSQSFGKFYEKTTNGCGLIFAIVLWFGWGPMGMLYCLGGIIDIFKIKPEYASGIHIRSSLLFILCAVVTIIGIIVIHGNIKNRSKIE